MAAWEEVGAAAVDIVKWNHQSTGLEGGLLMASGRHCASIMLGQDMSIAFIGPAGGEIEFAISESLALYIRQPQASCIFEG